MSIRLPLLAIAAAVLGSGVACGRNERMAAVTAAVRDAVAATGPRAGRAANAADLRAFYDARVGEPAWVDDDEPTRDAAKALEVLRSAVDHGLSSAAYAEPELTRAFDELTGEEKDGKAPADARALQLASQIEHKLGDTAAAARYVRRLGEEFPGAVPGTPGGSTQR